MEDDLLANLHPHVLEEGAALREGLAAGATRVRPRPHVDADVFLQRVAPLEPERAVGAREGPLLRAHCRHAPPRLAPAHAIATPTSAYANPYATVHCSPPTPTPTNAPDTCTTVTLRHGGH